jgi:para-aminobenzoate synthetase/4-amino-4-deoxychorismate lyase
LLAELEAGVEGRELWAVIALAYEAGPAFDPALRTHPGAPLPLLWAALYDEPETLDPLPAPATGAYRLGPLEPSVTDGAFLSAFDRVQEHIAAGDTYQVNLSLRFRTAFAGDPWALFHDLAEVGHPQGPGYGAFLHLGTHVVASASPELFLRLDGDHITSRPMKGTAPRGRDLDEDERRAHDLAASAKERAENVMVVDMVRNDLGRIARPGSVAVTELCAIERYPTVLQMTSTVTARSTAPVTEVLRALFPCASITGAPKVRATRILAALEPDPRGFYTGAIGVLAPGRRSQWSVAIRTAVVDLAAGRLEYGVGSGLVADSVGAREVEECRIKARVLTAPRPRFDLLESLLFHPRVPPDELGLWLLGEHLERLGRSAALFGYPVDPAVVRAELQRSVGRLPPRPHKVRLRVSPGGQVAIDAQEVEEPAWTPQEAPEEAWTVALAPGPVDPDDPLLYHKTTARGLYEVAAAARPEAREVLLWNDRGELTETPRFNLVAELMGRLVTPPAACGLLPGTFRAHLLRRGALVEGPLRPADLTAGGALYLINSVRGFRRARLLDGGPKGACLLRDPR